MAAARTGQDRPHAVVQAADARVPRLVRALVDDHRTGARVHRDQLRGVVAAGVRVRVAAALDVVGRSRPVEVPPDDHAPLVARDGLARSRSVGLPPLGAARRENPETRQPRSQAARHFSDPEENGRNRPAAYDPAFRDTDVRQLVSRAFSP